MSSTLKTLDDIEAGITLSFQQLIEVLNNARQEVLAIEQAKKECARCARCGSTDHVEPSGWAAWSMTMLCSPCGREAEHSFYNAEATEVVG